MHTTNVDRVILLSLLISPSISLPIPPADARAGGVHLESTAAQSPPHDVSRVTLGCSGLKKVLPADQSTSLKDENLLAALILADSDKHRAFDIPIIVDIEDVKDGIPSHEVDEDDDIDDIELDIELEPRRDLRKRDVTPPIAGRPAAKQPIRSQSAGSVSSPSHEQLGIQRSFSTGDLLAGGKKLHLVDPAMVAQKKQEMIETEVEEACGGFDDRYGRWFTSSGQTVSLEDFKKCVKDVKRRITVAIESAISTGTSTSELDVRKTKMADVAAKADSVMKAANRFLGSGTGEQRIIS